MGSSQIYKIMSINSAELEIPRETYQRELSMEKVHRIVKNFDEHIANEPKVSFRNGHYYVFDGQHTIAARKSRNHGKDLMIKCKVYFGMTESDEATLFAQQTGESSKLTAGAKIRALIYAGDPVAVSFQKATEAVGLRLDYSEELGRKRIACVSTAFKIFQKIGTEEYQEVLKILLEAWDGEPNTFRKENMLGLSQFIDLYKGEYNRKRLVKKLREKDPQKIYRDAAATGNAFPASKKYLMQVFLIYNGSSAKTALPLKF